jgi:nickel-dependent lactate racemase
VEDLRAAIEPTLVRPSMVQGKRVLVLTPDATRTAPLPPLIGLLHTLLQEYRAGSVTYMVALGTHRPLSPGRIRALYGIGKTDDRFSQAVLLNHRWDLPGTLVRLGSLEPAAVEEATGGMFSRGVDVLINRAALEHDLVIILGPVFPHEVAGFSGGYKYLFPGISGGEFLHFFHWVGAVNTCWATIGNKETPVRKLLRRAAGMLRTPVRCVSLVVGGDGGLAGVYAGDPEESWSAAADLSARLHVRTKRRAFDLVIGSAPPRYEDLWTGGKVMYKLEQVVRTGGTLVIHAPHITTLSHTWGPLIERAGYHVRDYFLGRLHRFAGIPLGVLAHCTHVKGLGAFEGGEERPRITVELAASLPGELVRRVNLGWRDPEELDLDRFRGREEEGVLVVDGAGEVLYRMEEGCEPPGS